MQRRKIGRSDLTISRIVFGSARFASEQDRDRIRVVHAALDAGLTSVDTAPLYDFGGVEAMLGRALRDRRERVEILSKVGLRWDGSHGDILFEFTDAAGARRAVRRDSRPEALRRDVEESLARLQTDRIDLCQLHQPDRRVPVEDSLGELSRLVEEGKVRAIGVSNFDPTELAEAIAASDATHTGRGPESGVVSHQLHYSLIERTPERELLPLARSHGLGTLAYSPLEAGVLAGKFLDSPGESRSGDDFRFDTPIFHETNVARVNAALGDTVLPIGDRYSARASDVCLAWLLAGPDVTGVIAGASTEAQASALAHASELALDADEIAKIGERFAALHIDEDAGLSWARKTRRHARRIAGRIKRAFGPR